MSQRNSIIRATNSLSLSAWFGGSLMGAISLRRAAGDRTEGEGAGWSAWQPVQTLAIVSQLASGLALTVANKGRYVGQRGVATVSVGRTALTGAAIAATVLAARSGRQLEREAAKTDEPGARPDRRHALERRTRALQWSVPALTGALVAIDAVMGEQQRPTEVIRGVIARVLPEPVAERLVS